MQQRRKEKEKKNARESFITVILFLAILLMHNRLPMTHKNQPIDAFFPLDCI